MRDHEPGRPFPWTLRKLVAWLASLHGVLVCRETVRRVLHRAGLSYKKGTKVLSKACPAKRAAYLAQIEGLLKEATHGERVLLFIDPAHIHQDCDLGRGWAPRGERLLVSSSSPGLSKRVTFYGVYVYNEGSVRIWPYERANAENTMDVLERLGPEFAGQRVTLIWDGASYHRAKRVKEKVEELGWDLVALPGYSPDFMPVEELWRWFRSEVTWNQVHETGEELMAHAANFERELNEQPYVVADRLVVLTRTDHDMEELRFSA